MKFFIQLALWFELIRTIILIKGKVGVMEILIKKIIFLFVFTILSLLSQVNSTNLNLGCSSISPWTNWKRKMHIWRFSSVLFIIHNYLLSLWCFEWLTIEFTSYLFLSDPYNHTTLSSPKYSPAGMVDMAIGHYDIFLNNIYSL